MKRFVVMDQIERKLVKSYNWLSKFLWMWKPKEVKKVLERNKELRNIEKKECIILGNGPSLRDIDLSAIKKYPKFTVNHFYQGYSELISESLHDYYVAIDEKMYSDENLKHLIQYYWNNPNTFFIFQLSAKEKVEQVQIPLDRFYFIDLGYMQFENFIRINMEGRMTSCLNVVLCCIQCALYMGYKTIYLLGCDFNSYTTLTPGHFYNNGVNRMVPIAQDLRCSSRVLYHHYALESYAKEQGVSILNLTENSLIDAYQRGNWDTIEPLRKEAEE